MRIRPATAADLTDIAALAADAQADPARHCAYVSMPADAVAEEIGEIDDWTTGTVVAEADDATLVAALIAEPDEDMGRVWWWGPFWAAGVEDPLRLSLDLWAAAPAQITSMPEHELCGDGRNTTVDALAAELGFRTDEASAVLTFEITDGLPAPAVAPSVREMTAEDGPAVAALHELHFAGSHLPADQAGSVGDERIRLVAVGADGGVAAYAIAELQADGGGYLDFLGTHLDAQGRGHGTDLVAACVAEFARRGCRNAHLTVRESNTAARRVYEKAGFTEERLLRPRRRGFALG